MTFFQPMDTLLSWFLTMHQYLPKKCIAPGHPATNGLAERNVQTLKNKLKSMINENVPIHQKIQKILLRYRATPLASGRSPSEMYLNRQIRIKLDAMRPYQEERSQQQIQPRTRCLQVGERVQARVFISNRNQASHHQTLIRSNTLFYSLNQINRSIMTPTRHLIRNLHPCLIHPYADHNAQDDPRDILRTMSTQPEI
ncbi:hypothetical protein LAZ67_10002215 [Cordylochernes scorpioides]|uniref:Integrase catalytic domain-containing protein n=1 Tax=Cordylochernes scorpioides TaxID=51811 RepID=A0ABY6KWJ0_9ARAC|nr:hypothetical protein LAZ67_10002215 [Cordylochernes scorpioides]